MKTKMGILLAILISLAIIESCKKESSHSDRTLLNSNREMELIGKIEKFLSQSEKQIRGDQIISVDSAIWLIESGANYTYGKGSKQNMPFVLDSVFISLPIQEIGMTSIAKSYDAYTKMINKVRAQFRKIINPGKSMVALHLMKKYEAVDSVTLKAIFQVALGVTLKSAATSSDELCYFNDVDWYHWYSGGICDGPNIGQHPERNLESEMMRHINTCVPVPGEEFWYSDIEIRSAMPWAYPNPGFVGGEENNNHFQYRLYWNCSLYPDFHTCLSPSELSFYLNNGRWVINTPVANGGAKPEGKSHICTSIVDDLIAPIGSSTCFERFEITYGLLHYGGLGDPLD